MFDTLQKCCPKNGKSWFRLKIGFKIFDYCRNTKQVISFNIYERNLKDK